MNLRRSVVSLTTFVCFALTIGFAQSPTFTPHRNDGSDGKGIRAHGDFNNDGREDVVVFDSNTGKAELQLYLSNGDATYDTPLPLAAEGGGDAVAAGDFNQDGKLDYADAGTGRDGTSTNIHVYLGNGNGSFQPPKLVANASSAIDGLVAEDMNHNGKTDLVAHASSTTHPAYEIDIFLSNGDGTFTPGQVTSPVTEGAITAGDYDGDGKADAAIAFGYQNQTHVEVWYGDGAGHLGAQFDISGPSGQTVDFSSVEPFGDYNSDGRSDLFGQNYIYGTGGSTQYLKRLGIFAGNANRTLTFKYIQFTDCEFSPLFADFNGDGVKDMVTAARDCTNPFKKVLFRPGTGPGTFGAAQTIYSPPVGTTGLVALSSSRDTKPDIALTEFVKLLGDPSKVDPQGLTILNNTTAGGKFAGCVAPNNVNGINVCSPTSSSASPVNFSAASAGDTPMRKMEVWVDGTKRAEQLYAFSNYSFFDQAISLPTGSHNVSIYGAGWDNSLVKKSFTLNVTSGGGGCSTPASATATVICSPASGSTVSNPVNASAKGGTSVRNMELWVDGTRRATSTGNSIAVTLTLSAGTHKLTAFGKNGSTVLSSAVSNFTVK